MVFGRVGDPAFCLTGSDKRLRDLELAAAVGRGQAPAVCNGDGALDTRRVAAAEFVVDE